MMCKFWSTSVELERPTGTWNITTIRLFPFNQCEKSLRFPSLCKGHNITENDTFNKIKSLRCFLELPARLRWNQIPMQLTYRLYKPACNFYRSSALKPSNVYRIAFVACANEMLCDVQKL